MKLRELLRGIIYMKKKIFAMCLAAVVLAAAAGGCGKEKEPPVTIAVVTDGGNADDMTANQALWQAASGWGDKNKEKSGCYVPEDGSREACEDAIETAVKKGAEVILCHGEEAAAAVYSAQRQYRDVRFLVFDASPHKDGKEKPGLRGNTRSILFNHEEAGFLAGYAAVKEGYRDLAYYGGEDTGKAKEYGAGFLEGAQAAAKEDKLSDGAVKIRYEERNDDGVSPQFMNEVEELYRNGCQAIFTDGGGFEPIVRRAAEITGGHVIGVRTDESQKSFTVVISAENRYDEIVKRELDQIRDGEFEGGKTVTFGTAEGGTGLTVDTMQMQNFTKEQAEAAEKKLADGGFKLRGTEILKKKDSLKALDITESKK